MDKIKRLCSGVLLAYAITVFVFLIYSILLTYTGITERFLSGIVIITVGVSAFIAGAETSKAQKSRGIFWGFLAGAFYVFFVVALMYAFSDILNIGRAISFLIISLIAGGFGGVVGINFKNPKKTRI